MTLLINTLISALAILLYSGLYIIVTISKHQTELRRVFRWYLLAMGLWSIFAFLIYTDQSRATLWFKMMIASGLGTMMSAFLFSRTTINIRNRLDTLVIIFGFIMMGLSIFTGLVTDSAVVESGVIHYKLSPFTVLLAGPGYLLVIISLAILVRYRQRSTDSIERNRLMYLILGMGGMIIGSSINFTELGKYPLDIAANGVSAILFVYAILRYQLLDIQVVIRQGLVYSIPTIIIGATYFLIINLSVNLLHFVSGAEIFLLSLVVAIITALVAEPLRGRAQKIIDRMF
ncbi:MAG: hypothetical protein MUP11_05270, partial [Anaerolineales bacterium]|nr:hypothetical protein [Anaerolineales bacterium]